MNGCLFSISSNGRLPVNYHRRLIKYIRMDLDFASMLRKYAGSKRETRTKFRVNRKAMEQARSLVNLRATPGYEFKTLNRSKKRDQRGAVADKLPLFGLSRLS